MNHKKYKRQYFPVNKPNPNWVKKETIEKPPIWCSVDLRDGNQSLVVPMTLNEKLEFFKTLVKTGFKEIEIGFPAASDTEFEFSRRLIEDKLIPDDVTIQVLTQAREHIIKKTFEAIRGAKSAIVHVYNSTSQAQREQVFKKSKDEILKIAINGAKLVKQYAEQEKGNYRFEYSPESFTGTETDFALDVCNAVLDIWKPSAEKKAIINLPATVQHSCAHVYANQVEYFCENMKHRENVIISLHPHNDRGTSIADCELGLLAGADRIEGTLFGNGERTGNADIVTLALNMYSQGINPKLDFSNMPRTVEAYEKATKMHVHERSPYAGSLVFCAFSGSHQDAIAKGMKHRETEIEKAKQSGTKTQPAWTVPYLPVDPCDLGRCYQTDVIRINSQSGKGGVGYILEQGGYNLPPKMREAVGYAVKNISDKQRKELSPEEVTDIFIRHFINVQAPIKLVSCTFGNGGKNEKYSASVSIIHNEERISLTGTGNGRLDAVANAITNHLGISIEDLSYNEHTLGTGSDSKACSYIGLKTGDQKFFGVGVDNDIMLSSIKAFISAVNNSIKKY